MTVVHAEKQTVEDRLRTISRFILIGATYWIADSLVDAYIYRKGTLISQMFSLPVDEVYMRTLTIIFLLIAVYALSSIGKQKKVAKALQESEEKYRSVVENVGLGISLISPDMTILSLNSQMKKWFPDIDVANKPVCYRAFNHPAKEGICSYCPTCKTLADGQNHESVTDTPSGDEIRNYRVISSPVKDPEGKVIAAIEMVEDITEQIRAQTALAKSETAYRELVENVRDVIYNISVDGTILSLNPAFETITGWEQGKWLGKNFSSLVHPEDLPWALALFQQILNGEFPHSYEFRILTKSGGYRTGEFLAKPKFMDGKVVGAFGIARDITERRMAEEALRESEERYRLLFQRSPIGIFHYDLRLIITDCNKRFENILRSSVEKLIGLDMKTLNDSSVIPALSSAIKGKDGFYEGFYRATTSSAEIWVSLQTAPLFDRQGNIIGGVGIVEDITDRKETYDALVRQTRLAVLGAEIGVALTGESSLRETLQNCTEVMVKHLDAAFARIWTLNKNENVLELQASAGMYTHIDGPHSRVPVGKLKIGLIAQERKPHLTNSVIGDPSVNDQDWARREGMVAFAGYPLIVSDRLVGVAAIFARHPIDDAALQTLGAAANQVALGIERKQKDDEFFQITHDWEDTFNSITDMVTIHDKDYNIIHANKAAEKILGLPLLDVTPGKCFRYYHGTEKPPEGCPSCDCLKTGIPAAFELYEPHLNMFIEIRAIPRFDSGNNLIGLIHVVRDISGRKKLEDQLRQAQKMEAIGRLAGGIAHDFNNMLTAIIGYANILKMKMRGDDPLKVNLDQILAASERGAYLTQSLLAFSRQQISNPGPVNLGEIIRKIETLLLRVIGEDIDLRVALSEDLIVLADNVQIEQVLINLCTNARDAMPKGGVLVIETSLTELDREFIAAHGYGKPGHYALISVSDTGAGIDESIRERIFDPFFTTKGVGKGTGLGLSIVYGIIKQHNGYITCYSEPGKGTTFKIYLPIIEAKVKEAEQEVYNDLKGSTVTILLAEDEPAVRSLTKHVLEEFGHRVIEAADGREAVNKFSENKDNIELLIFDVIMPKMNGKEAYDRIKAMRPDIKVLFTSGYPADFIHRQEIMEEGLNFVSKPVSPAGLLRKVKEVLEK
ncbi:MAG: PAS domain S-box protein [Nitrospirae bacterium]|nr:PAS domain S-box protein [Nitrospirota bacterium]